MTAAAKSTSVMTGRALAGCSSLDGACAPRLHRWPRLRAHKCRIRSACFLACQSCVPIRSVLNNSATARQGSNLHNQKPTHPSIHPPAHPPTQPTLIQGGCVAGSYSFTERGQLAHTAAAAAAVAAAALTCVCIHSLQGGRRRRFGCGSWRWFRTARTGSTTAVTTAIQSRRRRGRGRGCGGVRIAWERIRGHV